MTDSVAASSGFLCTYMSNHPDTLVAYVREFGKVKGTVESAKMTSIDSNQMSFEYILKGGEKKSVSVKFDPPLSGYEEVKPRLLGMKLDAEESLGMTKRPQITKFELHNDAFITIFALSFLIYVTFSVSRPYSTIQNLGPWIRTAVGPTVMKISWGICIFLHSMEALYVASLCRRHSTGVFLGLKWTSATLLLGFPALRRLRSLIQKARIESIQKIH